MSFKSKSVIVTGGGSGIGAAIAIEFAKEGANVAIVGRSVERLKQTADKCTAIGKEVLTIGADVSKEEDVERIIKTTIDKFGQLDVLVNNAGIGRTGSLCEGDVLKAYDEVMNTNIRAVIHLTKLAVPYLQKAKGNVINISSVNGVSTFGVPIVFTYNISKAALNHFGKCAALELAPLGIRVNTISSGPVETDIIVHSNFPGTWEWFKRRTALDRVSDPQEIADLVLFLASEKAKAVTGSNVVSDNGLLVKY